MAYLTEIDFTPDPVRYLHVDFNSCFASIEQQANPKLRHHPTAVVARPGPSGCILASSYDAKRLGITTGTRLKEALAKCPGLNVVYPDPDKYRHVHKKLKKLLLTYTHLVTARSIDEFSLNLDSNRLLKQDLVLIAQDIKQRIKAEIGDYLTVSIGLAPSSFLAKTAAGLKKPDGLEIIDRKNYLSVYASMKLTDLCGINHRLAARLYRLGITSPYELFYTPPDLLKADLGPAFAHYWHFKLRGYQLELPTNPPKSFGHSFVLPRPLPFSTVLPILSQLLQKATRRMRLKNFQAQGVSLYLGLQDAPSFVHHLTVKEPFFEDSMAWQLLSRLLHYAPKDQLIRATAVTLFAVSPLSQIQLNLFDNRLRQNRLINAVDQINTIWGDFTIAQAPSFFAKNNVPDSIGFGRIGELERN